MVFKLSARSLSKLKGVNPQLVAVVHKAILITDVEFGVICGLRTIEEQKELVAKKLSQTMSSRHLTGHAVDLMAYVQGRPCWEIQVYDEIAEAMQEAAQEEDVGLVWGAAWHIPNICDYMGTMEDAYKDYLKLRLSQGRRPFVDAPHFEMSK